MAQLQRPDLHAEIDLRFPDNATEQIIPSVMRAFLHELVDSVALLSTFSPIAATSHHPVFTDQDTLNRYLLGDSEPLAGATQLTESQFSSEFE
jgi:hypothetical protein